MNEELVRRSLQALAKCDRHLEAPPCVEDRVMQQFSSEFRPARKRMARPLGVVAIAALLTVGIILTGIVNHRPETLRKIAAPSVVVFEPHISLNRVVPIKPISVTSANALPSKPNRFSGNPARDPEEQIVEVVTDFFPLLDSAPPFERGEILRVQLPASAMRAVGLPVREEQLQNSVQADVVVGEEGLARAIRFVEFQRK